MESLGMPINTGVVGYCNSLKMPRIAIELPYIAMKSGICLQNMAKMEGFWSHNREALSKRGSFAVEKRLFLGEKEALLKRNGGLLKRYVSLNWTAIEALFQYKEM